MDAVTHHRYTVNLNDEEADAPMCRFCHDTGGDDLISPCACSGSVKYVHRECLDEWRSTSSNHDSFWMCNTCHVKYKFEYHHNPDREKTIWLRITRDLILAALAITATICILAYFVYVFDYSGSIPEKMYLPNHPKFGYVAAILFGIFALVGLGVFIALISMGEGGNFNWNTNDEGVYGILVLFVVLGGIATLAGLVIGMVKIVRRHSSRVRRKLSVKDYVVLSI